MASYTRDSRSGGTASSRSISASVSVVATDVASATVTVSGHNVSVTGPLEPAASLPVPSIELGRLGADRAIGADDDAVDALLRLVELQFAMPFQLGSPLIGL